MSKKIFTWVGRVRLSGDNLVYQFCVEHFTYCPTPVECEHLMQRRGGEAK